MTQYPLVFRTSPWIFVILGIGLLISLVGVRYFFLHSGIGIETIGFVSLSLLFLAGLLDGLFSRTVLGEDTLEFVSNFRRTRINRADIQRVVGEKGVPVAVQLQSGEWIKLGSTSPHANTIRAWVKRNERRASAPDSREHLVT